MSLCSSDNRFASVVERAAVAQSIFETFFDLGNPCLCQEVAEDTLIRTIAILDRVRSEALNVIEQERIDNTEVLFKAATLVVEAKDILQVIVANDICALCNEDFCNALNTIRDAYVLVCRANAFLLIIVGELQEEESDFLD